MHSIIIYMHPDFSVRRLKYNETIDARQSNAFN